MPTQLKKGDTICSQCPLTVTKGRCDVEFPPEFRLIKDEDGVQHIVPRLDVDKLAGVAEN